MLGSVLTAVVAAPAGASTVWAVGDGAYSGNNDVAVTNLMAGEPADQLLYLGDVYDTGTAAEFANYYQPTYGRFKAITKPAPGNHEWGNRATGYDPYWGPTYTTPHYYSFDTGGWHVVSLNSEEAFGEGSPQLAWLRADIAGHAGNCTLAYWHRPRFSAGSHGDQTDVEPLWRALAGHASIVLNGHDHDYLRYKPIDGITEFVVGTGGKSLYAMNAGDTRLAASDSSSYGALRLSLTAGRADFNFKTTGGGTLDTGSIACADQVAPPPNVGQGPTLTLKRKRLRLKHGARRLRLRFELSKAAKVELQTQRLIRGRYGAAKSRTLALDAGNNTVAVSRRSLRSGLFRITLVASDAAGHSSEPVSVKLRVVR